MTQPLAVASVGIPGVSLSTAAADIVRQWGTFFPFRGITMTLPLTVGDHVVRFASAAATAKTPVQAASPRINARYVANSAAVVAAHVAASTTVTL